MGEQPGTVESTARRGADFLNGKNTVFIRKSMYNLCLKYVWAHPAPRRKDEGIFETERH